LIRFGEAATGTVGSTVGTTVGVTVDSTTWGGSVGKTVGKTVGWTVGGATVGGAVGSTGGFGLRRLSRYLINVSIVALVTLSCSDPRDLFRNSRV